MTHALDTLTVGLILIIALAYAAATLGPKSWRSTMLKAAGRTLSAAPRPFALGGLGARLSAAALKSKAACGGCDGCAPAEASSQPGSGAEPKSGAARSGAEVKIPVASIGRRATH